MKTSEQIDIIAGALVRAQAAIRPASKTAENPFHKSHYADLAACIEVARGPLEAQGLAFMAFPSTTDGSVSVTARIQHAGGQWMEADPVTVKPKELTPQAFGLCLTYLRRYLFVAMLNIATEDDDGETAEGRGGVKSAPQAHGAGIRSAPTAGRPAGAPKPAGTAPGPAPAQIVRPTPPPAPQGGNGGATVEPFGQDIPGREETAAVVVGGAPAFSRPPSEQPDPDFPANPVPATPATPAAPANLEDEFDAAGRAAGLDDKALDAKWIEVGPKGEAAIKTQIARFQRGVKQAPGAGAAPLPPAEAGVDPSEVAHLHGWVRSAAPKKAKDGHESKHWFGGLIKPKDARGCPEGSIHAQYGSCPWECRLDAEAENVPTPDGLAALKGAEVLLSGPGWAEWTDKQGAPHWEFKATNFEVLKPSDR